jgi:hypothetical protein
MPLVETSHTVDIKIENGIATYTVRRMFKNPGDLPEQVELQLGLPYGAAATGLRIKAKDVWHAGVLMEREAAAKLYEEMTGIGQFKPKDPALLAWMWADTLSLQVFPVMPKTTSTVEYTLTAPTRYAGGRYFVSYPRTAELAKSETSSLPLATPVVTVHFGWGDAGTKVNIDGKDVKRDSAVRLDPPPHQDWEDLIQIDKAASYVASKLVIPSSSHTEKDFASAKLAIDLRHTYKSDLRVELLTPQNQRVEVHDGTGSGANDIRGTYTLALPPGTSAAGPLVAVHRRGQGPDDRERGRHTDVRPRCARERERGRHRHDLRRAAADRAARRPPRQGSGVERARVHAARARPRTAARPDAEARASRVRDRYQLHDGGARRGCAARSRRRLRDARARCGDRDRHVPPPRRSRVRAVHPGPRAARGHRLRAQGEQARARQRLEPR